MENKNIRKPTNNSKNQIYLLDSCFLISSLSKACSRRATKFLGDSAQCATHFNRNQSMVYTAHRSKSIIAGVLDLKYMRVPVRRESSRNKIAFLFYFILFIFS